MSTDDWRALHTERHIRVIKHADNIAAACARVAKWELSQVSPDFAAAIDAMISCGVPPWDAARIVGRVVEHLYPLDSRDSRALNGYVRDAFPRPEAVG